MTRKQRKILIACLLIFGFMALEFPGIIFVCEIVRPFVLGLPFLYGYILIGWLYMCLVLLYAYLTGWGKHPIGKKNPESSGIQNE